MNNYIVATIHPWNIKIFHEKISQYPGIWTLITTREELTVELIERLNPKYIFFPQWSYKVSNSVLDTVECVCFHATNLPYGRGGTPIQNLIIRGHRETTVTAIRMVEELDAGLIYLQKPFSLEGLAEEIYIRLSGIVANMIYEIVTHNITPVPQTGKVEVFKRRTPEQCEIVQDTNSLSKLFDFIRMVDAEGYPKAFIEYGNFRLEFSRPALRHNRIESDVKISLRDK